jgi:hypothetical protein
MKYIITKTDAFINSISDGGGDNNFACTQIYTLFDLTCFAISEPLFDTLYPLLPVGFEEVTRDEAAIGAQHFGEIKDTVKAFVDNPDWDYTSAMPDAEKINKEMTAAMKDNVRMFMYRFAKEIIENEYNYRFKNIRNATEMEHASWEVQLHEANEWLTYGEDVTHITPFLDYLALERGINKTELSDKIITKNEAWKDRLSSELVKSQILLGKFKDALTIKDMNVLYEDYFGIMMPTLQAQELNRANADGDRITPDGLIDLNNPYMGQKLNF